MTLTRLSELAAGQSICNWLVLGPFVVRTTDHFEREYMYERERILDIDYLEADGGEAHVQPEAGQSHPNIGLGPQRIAWREYTGTLLEGMDLAGPIIYETVQRNCVFYAAAHIEAETGALALLDAYHSGMKVWVNGALAANMPYGIPKGVALNMPMVPIQLNAGSNLVLIKFRPGYICDRVDFRLNNVRIAPMAVSPGCPIALGRVRPLEYFRGTPDEPRQVIEAYALNTSTIAHTVTVSAASHTLRAEDSCQIVCEPGKPVPVRLSLLTPPKMAGKSVQATLAASAAETAVQADIAYEAAEPPKHDGTCFVLSNFHFDTTYHEEQRVYAMGAFDIVREYCRLHRRDPNFRSIISEVDYLKPYFDVYPEDRETLMRVFRDQHSEPDVMYNQPNEQNCGDEGLVRNFLYGQLIHGRVFGNICHVYGPEDVFGHPNQLSQIARKSGCIGCTWGKHIFNFPPFFNHLALDGSALPHERGRATEEDVQRMGLSVRRAGIDQTPNTDWHATLMPVYQQGTFNDLITAIHRECEEKDAHLPLTSRDMSLYHAATALSRTDLKIANRLGENMLLDAEKFATIANLMGAQYPEKALDKAWRQILCGQHHDSITGTHNEISFVDLMNSYREVLELGSDVISRSLDHIAGAVDTDAGENITVFNPLAWKRTDTVTVTITPPKRGRGFSLVDPGGNDVPFEVIPPLGGAKPGTLHVRFLARNLPSLGYRVYRVVPAKQAPASVASAEGTVIENEFYRVKVDPQRGGGMVSLYDKKAKRELIDATTGHVGNELAILEEVSYRNETQHEFYTTGLKMFSGDQPADVELEKGPVSSTLRIRFTMGELSGVVQEITLQKGVKRVDFRTILKDWQREDYLYCITFPTNLEGCVPVFDERFGAVARNESKNYLDFRTHQMIMFSDCGVYAANKWMEYGNSATLAIGPNAYPLSMIGLITPESKNDIAAGERIQQALIRKGVTCTPWFDHDGPHWGSYLDDMDDDLLYTRFRISLGARGRNAYTKKLITAQPGSVRKAFKKRLDKDGFAFLFVKDAALKDATWPALPVLIIEAATADKLDEAVERLLDGFDKDATLRLPAQADATGQAHKVDDYGVAILNRGTYANSIEKGGTICMMLAHTCTWYGGTNNFPEGYLVPEFKNHAYTYALYPHAGDWRQGKTPRAAHEFNHPPLARQAVKSPKAWLPQEQSFLEVQPANIILTALKPFGNPIASFEKAQACNAAKGIMLRCYDTEGKDAQARITFATGIEEAWSANLLEEPQEALAVKNSRIALPVPAFSIETLGFRPMPFEKRLGRKRLGAEAEPVQPVWVRSWEHDAESMPMGYNAVVCSISREVHEEDEGRTLRLRVNAVNDYTDGPVSGTAEVVLPEGWSATPGRIDFELDPLAYEATELIVQRPTAGAHGQVKLRYTFDGQTFQDVLEIGRAFDLDMTVENLGHAIEVTVANSTAETVEAEVSMVTPIETWPADLVGSLSLLDIQPRTRGVSLAPGATQKLIYKVLAGANTTLAPEHAYWAVVKMMCNGRIRLERCDLRPEERRMYNRKWFALYREKGK